MRCAASLIGLIALWLMTPTGYSVGVHAQDEERPRLSVKPTGDFEITGAAEDASWQKTEWTVLRRR